VLFGPWANGKQLAKLMKESSSGSMAYGAIEIETQEMFALV